VLQTRPRTTHYIRFLSKEKSNHSRDPCTMALSQSVTIVTLSLVSFQTNRQDRSNYINKARENRNRKKIKKASPSIKSPMLALHQTLASIQPFTRTKLLPPFDTLKLPLSLRKIFSLGCYRYACGSECEVCTSVLSLPGQTQSKGSFWCLRLVQTRGWFCVHKPYFTVSRRKPYG